MPGETSALADATGMVADVDVDAVAETEADSADTAGTAASAAVKAGVSAGALAISAARMIFYRD